MKGVGFRIQGLGLSVFGVEGSGVAPRVRLGYDPSVKSQLASRNSLEGLVWCKSGHVPLIIQGNKTSVAHRVEIL